MWKRDIHHALVQNESLGGCLSPYTGRYVWNSWGAACVITCLIPHLDTPQLETNRAAFNSLAYFSHPTQSAVRQTTKAYMLTCTALHVSICMLMWRCRHAVLHFCLLWGSRCLSVAVSHLVNQQILQRVNMTLLAFHTHMSAEVHPHT